MDDNIKLIIKDKDMLKKISDSLKPSPALQEALKAIKKPLNIPALDLPSMQPDFNDLLKFTPPTQAEVNKYQSASALMDALSKEALLWKDNLPENYKPAILALLYGGMQINVQTLAQASFHGIRITGILNGGPCSLLAHQASVQMLCFGEEITEETPKQPIGFIWSGHSVEV